MAPPPPIRAATAMLVFAGALAVAGGCSLIVSSTPITQQSILQAARPSEDAVTLDIYWVRLPADTEDGGDAAMEPLWDQVDESVLPHDLRGRLGQNGLRAGVVPASIPGELLTLLDPDGAADASSDGFLEIRDTGVRRRTKQLRPGQELELNAADPVAEAPLLTPRDGGLSGRTYQQLQGVYTVEVDRADDGRTVLRLLPKIRHGAARLRYERDEVGAFSVQSLRQDTTAFPELTVAAPLAAGEMLLVANVPGSGSRLGGLMHHAAGERKAIVIRVSHHPRSTEFLPEA